MSRMRLTPNSGAAFRSLHSRVVTRLRFHPFVPSLLRPFLPGSLIPLAENVFHILFFQSPVNKLTRKGSSHQWPAILLSRCPRETVSSRPLSIMAHPHFYPNSGGKGSQASPLGPKPRAHSSSERREVRPETRDACVVFWGVPFGVYHFCGAQEV